MIRKERNREAKAVLGLAGGTLLGMTAQSIFEAWWVAPGSPEAAYFWALSGVALGLAQQSRRHQWAGRPRPSHHMRPHRPVGWPATGMPAQHGARR